MRSITSQVRDYLLQSEPGRQYTNIEITLALGLAAERDNVVAAAMHRFVEKGFVKMYRQVGTRRHYYVVVGDLTKLRTLELPSAGGNGGHPRVRNASIEMLAMPLSESLLVLAQKVEALERKADITKFTDAELINELHRRQNR